MGLLFVLIFWAFVLCAISLLLGLLGIIVAYFYSRHKKVKVRFITWFFAPGILLFFFAGLNFAVSIFYGIITNSDIGIGDYASENINKKYHLYWLDASDWKIDTRDSNSEFWEVEAFNHVQEILEHDDTIAFTSKIDEHYVLTQLNANKVEYAIIDSASTTDALWNKYTQTRGIDRDDVYTCDAYYIRYRKYFLIAVLAFNIFIFYFIFKKFKRFWRFLFLKK